MAAADEAYGRSDENDSYKRVEKNKEQAAIEDNEVRDRCLHETPRTNDANRWTCDGMQGEEDEWLIHGIERETMRASQVRITTVGKMANYISYATSLFQDKNMEVVVLKAMGKAINKTVTAGEGKHQLRGRKMVDATPRSVRCYAGLSCKRSSQRPVTTPLGIERASMG